MNDSSIADMYYLQLPAGDPTQGDIWLQLPIVGEPEEQCTGLLITPRCDLAHGKTSIVNYLPIVSLEKYITTEGIFPVVEKDITDAKEKLRSFSKVLDLEGFFALDVPISEIFQTVDERIKQNHYGMLKQVQLKDASELCGAYRRLADFTNRKKLTIEEAQLLNKRRVKQLQRDLIRNNNSDTFFLPPCSNLFPNPSVVLLRRIQTCSIDFFKPNAFERARDTSAPRPERLLRIMSPFIESLMGKFAALFTRFGTRDIPDAVVPAYFVIQETKD